MKKIIRYFFILLVGLIIINPLNGYALTEHYEYVINKYDVNINVNDDNTFLITETITAYFNTQKHGIFRTIPLRNQITRLDGTTSTNRAKVDNIYVDNEYKTSKENGNLKIKIGSAYTTITGEKTYTIKYKYSLSNDKNKEFDELYYNIIGTEWDTKISNISFSITMPKDFDTSKIGFSSGSYGSTDNSNVKYTVDGNRIVGSYNGTLDAYQGLTIRCELPEGYFEKSNVINSSIYIMFIVPISFLIISFILWYIFGKDDKVIETVEFYPPNGYNSLEVGLLYKGKASNKDVTSLLIYLANKGYIKIKEIESSSLFKSKDFEITKIRDYDGTNQNERLFLKGLFSVNHIVDFFDVQRYRSEAKKRGEKISYNEAYNKVLNDIPDKESVTSSDLYNEFYKTMNKILSNINNKDNKRKIFEKGRSPLSIITAIFMIISLILVISIPIIDYYGFDESIMIIMILIFYSPFIISLIVAKTNIISKILVLGFIFFHFYMMTRSFNLPEAFISESIYLVGLVVGIFCVIGIGLFTKYMSKRNTYGIEMLGKIKGFKNFLETAEKEKLEAMVLENPSYFYDILPYTYVLGVSDKWIKKFETISLQAPDWYDSPNNFDMVSFGNFMDSTMHSAESSMSSSPSSDSSGGGSSGGGSSGGGSGGGGGGSW